MLLQIKKIIPHKVLYFLSKTREKIWSFIDQRKPYLNHLNYNGFDLYFNRANGLINRIRFGNLDRVYERKLVENIVDELNIRKATAFIDVGSNIGLISLYVLSRISYVKIFAFEPGIVQNFLFQISIFANQLSNRIFLFNEALGHEVAKKSFVSHDDINNSGDGFIDTKRGGPKKRVVEVNSITLDSWWNTQGCPKIDVIKLDTEGAELWILQGGKKFIENCKPTIFIEISILNLQSYPHDHMAVFDWFFKENYELYTIDNIKCNRDNFDNIVMAEDSYIARPKYI